MDVKAELEKKAAGANAPAKLMKSMSIADLIKTMEPEIRKALPSVISTERFTRMALSALNNTPQLMECSQMSFLAALMLFFINLSLLLFQIIRLRPRSPKA